MTTEILNTGYVETGDDGVATTGYLRETSNTLSLVAFPQNLAASLGKDFGVDYFTSYYAEGKINTTSQGGTGARLLTFGSTKVAATAEGNVVDGVLLLRMCHQIPEFGLFIHAII